jgi:tetratricopeptide (TPR) repeat protein
MEDSYAEIGIASKLEGTMFLRVFQYLTGLKIIHDYPILGIGPETLGMIYPQYLSKIYRETGEYRDFKNQNRIHNDFLDIAVSRGLLGLGVYLWFVFAYARMVWKGCMKANSSDKILIIGLCASCLAYFIQNQFSFGHVPILTLFWFLIAMSVVASPVKYSLPDGMPARQCHSDGENPVTHKPELTRQVGGLTIRKFGKRTFCGIIVCLMILLITLCLFRYKADIYFEHGRRTLNKNEITEAIHSYEMAVKYNPLALNYNNVLNGIYLKMAETGVNKESKKITEGLPDLFSREQTTMWFAKAIDGAEQVQKLYPRDYHSAFTLGQAYHILDKISSARLPRPNRFDGQAGGGEDMSKEAFKNYKIATILHPFKFEFRNKLARLYAEKGQYEEAIHELKEAKSIAPSNQAAYLNLAKVFMNDRERYEEAEAVLLEFITKNPDKEIIDIYQLLSYIYLKTTKWGKVLDQSIKMIQIDPEDLEAHKNATMANFKLERYNDARKLCNRILNMTGQTNNTYNKYAKETLELLSEK